MMVDEDDDEEEAVEETDLSVVDAGPSNEEEGEDKKGEEEEEWEEQVPAYVEARRLFKEAEVAAADTVELTWKVRQALHPHFLAGARLRQALCCAWWWSHAD